MPPDFGIGDIVSSRGGGFLSGSRSVFRGFFGGGGFDDADLFGFGDFDLGLFLVQLEGACDLDGFALGEELVGWGGEVGVVFPETDDGEAAFDIQEGDAAVPSVGALDFAGDGGVFADGGEKGVLVGCLENKRVACRGGGGGCGSGGRRRWGFALVASGRLGPDNRGKGAKQGEALDKTIHEN